MSTTNGPDHYAEDVFGHRIGFGERPALLVVDMIKAFADPAFPFGFDLADVLRSTCQLLASVRAKHIPIVFTTTAYDDPVTEAGVWLRKMPALRELRTGAECTELMPDLLRRPHEPIICKKFASVFFGTSLASMLVSQAVDTLMIAGCTTSGCVRATAVDAVQHGFRPIIVGECIGDRLLDAHEASLRDLDAKYCDVVSLRKAIEKIESVCGGI